MISEPLEAGRSAKGSGLLSSIGSILGPSAFRGGLMASDGAGTFGEPVQKVCLFSNNLFEL